MPLAFYVIWWPQSESPPPGFRLPAATRVHSRGLRSDGGEEKPDEPENDSSIGEVEKTGSQPADTDAKKIDDVSVVEQAV